MAVVVAPILRFADVGFGADVRISQLGTPEKMISAFGPEIMGTNVDDMQCGLNNRTQSAHEQNTRMFE